MAEKEQDKIKLGFGTPSGEIQDKFDKLQTILGGEKTHWEEVVALAKSEHERHSEDLRKNAKKLNETQRLLKDSVLNHWHVILGIACLGVELTEIHSRLAKCEKNIDDLKLRTK